jgi:hypothetical protein
VLPNFVWPDFSSNAVCHSSYGSRGAQRCDPWAKPARPPNRPRSRLIAWNFLALCCLSISSFSQEALTVPRALDQLTSEAAVIVHGTVLASKIEPHPQLKNLMTILVTMRVTTSYKGNAPKVLVFRQYLWDLRAQLGARTYAKGQELLLLLGPTSEYGLTSPVGLEQGRFKIARDPKGQLTAVNGRGNVGLFNMGEQRARAGGHPLSSKTIAMAQKAGPLPLADLEDAIRSFVGSR